MAFNNAVAIYYDKKYILYTLQLEPFGIKTEEIDWDDLNDFRCPSYVSIMSDNVITGCACEINIIL